jgi:chorismate mutase
MTLDTETDWLTDRREDISRINFGIIDLLAEGREASYEMWELRRKRIEVVEQIAVYKKENNISPFCPEREKEMYEEIREYARSHGVDEERAVNYIKRLVEQSKQIQRGILKNARRS